MKTGWRKRTKLERIWLNRTINLAAGFVLFNALLLIHSVRAAPGEKRYEPFFAFGFNPEFTISEDKLEKGSAKAYLTEDFSLYRVYRLKEVPQATKQAIWDQSTQNPFTEAYAEVYSEDTAKALRQCDYWGQVKVDLDDNPRTDEWLIAVSEVLCMPDKYQHIFEFDGVPQDKVPHVWLLQKGRDGYRVLVEGDGSMVINNKPPHDGYREVVSLLKGQPLPKSVYGCGETELRWHYRGNHYEPFKQHSTAAGCKQAYQYGEYEQYTDDKAMTRAAARSASFEVKDRDEEYLVDIRHKASDFVDKLGFAGLAEASAPAADEKPEKVESAASPAPRNVAPEPVSAPSKPQPSDKTVRTRPAPRRTTPATDDIDLDKLIRSGALDQLLKP